MKKNRAFFAVCALLFLLVGPAGLRGDDIMRDYPKHLHWQGKIHGEAVTMDIDAGALVLAEHKIGAGGDLIDGYPAIPGYLTSWGTKFPHFIITNWRIRWGGKSVRIPRGIYTSVLTPDLRGQDLYCSLDSRNFSVQAATREDAIMVKMGCGYDGVTPDIVFVITKDSKAHRFVLRANS